MGYIPWLVFFLAVTWMIWKGEKAKRAHQHEKLAKEYRESFEAYANCHLQPEQFTEDDISSHLLHF